MAEPKPPVPAPAAPPDERRTQPANEPTQPALRPAVPRPPASSGSTIPPIRVPTSPLAPRVPSTGSTGSALPAVRPPTAPPPPPARSGTTIPNLATAEVATIHEYRIQRALGRGGMANVFLGQRPDGRLAAIKLLLPQYARDPEIVRRFLLEMKATASLRHEHVLEILDFGDYRGNYFIATEFMDAGSLRDLAVRAGGRLPPPVAAAILHMLLKGLGAAHAQNLVHRDVKPANVLLRSDGVAKLADFGIARAVDLQGLTRTGLLMGTPAYMSPEQARGEKVDARSDLFSAGVVLFELLTGFNPFSGPNETATLTKVLAADPPMLFEVNPALPPAFESLVGRLLAPDLTQRFANAEEAAAEVMRSLPIERTTRELVRDALADPINAWPKWAEAEARRHHERAEQLLQEGPARRPLAILELFRAHHLAPKQAAAEARLRELFQGRDPFAPPQNPKIAELEAELAQKPGSHALLMQLAALHKLELGLVKSIAYYKRALKVRPDDGFATGQLRALIGEEADVSFAHLTLKTITNVKSAPPAPVTTTGSQPPVARPAVFSPTPYVYTPPQKTELQRLAPKLVTAAVVLLVGFFAVRGISRFVSASAASVDESAEALRKGLSSQNATQAQQSTEIQQRAAQRRAEGEEEFAAAVRLLSGSATDRDQALLKLDQFRRAHPKSPHVADATFLLAKTQAETGRCLSALSELATFVQTAQMDARVAEVRMMQARCHEESGATADALDDLATLVREHPTSALVTPALAKEAELFEKRGDAATAKARWAEVLSRTGPADELHSKASSELTRLTGLGGAPPANVH